MTQGTRTFAYTTNITKQLLKFCQDCQRYELLTCFSVMYFDKSWIEMTKRCKVKKYKSAIISLAVLPESCEISVFQFICQQIGNYKEDKMTL